MKEIEGKRSSRLISSTLLKYGFSTGGMKINIYLLKSAITTTFVRAAATIKKEGNQYTVLSTPYVERLPLTDENKKELLTLCSQNVITRLYHQYY